MASVRQRGDRTRDSEVVIVEGVPNVFIRDVAFDDLAQLRAVAAERGTSLQNFLRDAVYAQAVWLRRHAAIARTAQRLEGQAEVPDSERQVVLAAVDRAHDERAEQLIDRPAH